MRSRDMMTKLDRLPSKKEAVKVWDLSLLSPAEQDRASELMNLLRKADDIQAENLEPDLMEFRALVKNLPMLGEDEPEQGPTIEVPYDLGQYWCWIQKASSWRHYSFGDLGKVQTLRFCRALPGIWLRKRSRSGQRAHDATGGMGSGRPG
jgi:hypothetical protein